MSSPAASGSLLEPNKADVATLGDAEFIRRCRALRHRRHLLWLAGIAISDTEDFHLIDRLKYSRRVRQPSLAEWALLNSLEGKISNQTTDSVRLQISVKNARLVIFNWTKIALILSVLSFVGESSLIWKAKDGAFIHLATLPLYIIFAVNLGFLGATTYLSLTSISAKSEHTFDITDSDLVKMRILIGGLFALCLSVPWTPRAFWDFSDAATKDNDIYSHIDEALKFMLLFFSALVHLSYYW